MFQETSRIRRLNPFRPALFEVELESPEIASAARPGQFVHLLIEGTPQVLLRRPFSIAGVTGDRIRLIVKIVGRGTRAFSQYKIGDTCDLIGPLGSGFGMSNGGEVVLIGGGIGVAPLLFLQDELAVNKIPVTFFLGGRSRDEFPLECEEVARRGIIACTDDGSYGEPGLVSAVFERFIHAPRRQIAKVYSCGPTVMLKETARLCRDHLLSHSVSLESRMGCGMGVCQGCAVKVALKQGPGAEYRLVCTDGPVFDADLIAWDSIV
jgi:dihydroorotate dehydrogenase electron transfer subunit